MQVKGKATQQSTMNYKVALSRKRITVSMQYMPSIKETLTA